MFASTVPNLFCQSETFRREISRRLRVILLLLCSASIVQCCRHVFGSTVAVHCWIAPGPTSIINMHGSFLDLLCHVDELLCLRVFRETAANLRLWLADRFGGCRSWECVY
jgi:hypothetical protein